jgi:hypothetical protein
MLLAAQILLLWESLKKAFQESAVGFNSCGHALVNAVAWHAV